MSTQSDQWIGAAIVRERAGASPADGEERRLRQWLAVHPRAGRWVISGILATFLSGFSLAAFGGSPAEPEARGILRPVAQVATSPAGTAESGVRQGESHEVRQHTHARFSFDQDIERVAVGGEHLLDVQVLNTRELLALGLEPGTTSVMVWFSDGAIESLEIVVTEDLRLLEAVLADVHPGIRVQKAPDRDALVLTGTVSRAVFSRRAEDVTRSWLDTTSLDEELLTGEVARGLADAQSLSDDDGARKKRNRSGKGAVINLIRIEGVPELSQGAGAEDLILDAIASIGGEKVTVRRVQKGTVPDDEVDILVLEGEVEDQIALIRVLSLAYKVYVGRVKGPDVVLTDGVSQTTRVIEGDDLSILEDLEVIADEAGGLYGASAGGGQDSRGSENILQGFGRSGGGGGGRGGVRGMGLENRVGSNIARASAIELADGRILSFIEVTDLPQVRVDIRLYEVNRTKLLAYESDLAVQTSDFDQPGLEPAAGATVTQGSSAARVGAQGGQDIQNVFGFLGGTISNQLQISGSNWAVDSILGFLETEGIARSLANPSLSVLSGEYAIFEVGGRIPIDEAFATQVGIQGVFNSTRFIDYGVNLAVRPLVGKDDYITIDFAPEVTTPDALLTQLLVEATGKNPSTFAFESRLLKTSSRLLDGHTLLVGGLAQTQRSDEDHQAPWLSKIPLIGLLFQGFDYSDDDLEVVVMIRPTIVRDPLAGAGWWAYPCAGELLAGALPVPPPPPAEEVVEEPAEELPAEEPVEKPAEEAAIPSESAIEGEEVAASPPAEAPAEAPAGGLR